MDLTAAIAEPKASSELQFLDIAVPPQNTEPAQAATPPEPDDLTEEPLPLPGLISEEFVPPKEGSYHLHPELAHDYGSAESLESAKTPELEEDLGVEPAEEVELQSSGASEFRVPNAAEEFHGCRGDSPGSGLARYRDGDIAGVGSPSGSGDAF